MKIGFRETLVRKWIAAGTAFLFLSAGVPVWAAESSEPVKTKTGIFCPTMTPDQASAKVASDEILKNSQTQAEELLGAPEKPLSLPDDPFPELEDEIKNVDFDRESLTLSENELQEVLKISKTLLDSWRVMGFQNESDVIRFIKKSELASAKSENHGTGSLEQAVAREWLHPNSEKSSDQDPRLVKLAFELTAKNITEARRIIEQKISEVQRRVREKNLVESIKEYQTLRERNTSSERVKPLKQSDHAMLDFSGKTALKTLAAEFLAANPPEDEHPLIQAMFAGEVFPLFSRTQISAGEVQTSTTASDSAKIQHTARLSKAVHRRAMKEKFIDSLSKKINGSSEYNETISKHDSTMAPPGIQL